jgi:hypothetical protein
MTMTVRVIGINYIQLLIHKNFIFPAHGQAKNFWLVCAGARVTEYYNSYLSRAGKTAPRAWNFL